MEITELTPNDWTMRELAEPGERMWGYARAWLPAQSPNEAWVVGLAKASLLGLLVVVTNQRLLIFRRDDEGNINSGKRWNIPYDKMRKISLDRHVSDMDVLIMLGVLFAAVVAAGVRSTVRRIRGRREPGDLVFAYAGLTVLWVGLVSTAFELGENDRFRVMVDPIIIGLGSAIIISTVSRLLTVGSTAS